MSTPWIVLFYNNKGKENEKIVGMTGERRDGSLLCEQAQRVFTEVKDCGTIHTLMEQVDLGKWVMIADIELYGIIGQVDVAIAVYFDEQHNLRLQYLEQSDDMFIGVFACNYDEWDSYYNKYILNETMGKEIDPDFKEQIV